MKIFISYGHDEHSKLAVFIKKELEADGYEVWLDQERIPSASDWAIKIEQGITASQWVILLMTEHSVRRPDGVCLDEVSFARMLGKQIAPLMVQKVQPPLCIARIQWMDMQKYLFSDTEQLDEDYCLKKILELKNLLKGLNELGCEGGHTNLLECLKPLNNDLYYEYYSKDFYGRKWLFKAYDQWINDKSGSRIFWLIGKAGIGKTAFIATLCSRKPEISAVHFCKYNNNERSDPKKAIMSIAFHLATQIPDYKEEILKLGDLYKLKEKNVSRLFEYLLIEPLHKIKSQVHNMVIVIDALDEASWNGNNELVEIIAQEFNRTPTWLKLVLTSRPEPLLTRKLSHLTPLVIEENFHENNADIKGYLKMKLCPELNMDVDEATIDKIASKCAGNFLYATEIIKEINKGRLDIKQVDSFPEGLTGVYNSYFDRIFKENAQIDYKRDARPLIELIVASFEPLNKNLISDILSWDDYQIEEALEVLYVVFYIKNEVIEPLHKSLTDWLTDSKRSGMYRVSLKIGHKRMADYFILQYKKRHFSGYLLNYYIKHLLEVEAYDKAAIALSDLELIDKRIEENSLDSTIREYFNEIYKLKQASYKEALKVLDSYTFQTLLSKHRRYIYNSGLFFLLKDCGFNSIIDQKKQDWELGSEIGCAYFYYITEDYSNTLKATENIFQVIRGIDDEGVKAELHNLAGCCYRKLALFGESYEQFQKARKAAEMSGNLLELSAALMNMAKINYHRLEWQKAIELNEEGIKRLKDACEVAVDEDTRKSLTMLIAEYYRLSAETFLWNLQLAPAKKYLEKAQEIYDLNQSRDRYYLRYMYSLAFYWIVAGHYVKAIELLEGIVENSFSKYDKAQIGFYLALARLLKGEKSESIENNLIEALDHLRDIDAYLEMEEIITLGIKLQEKSDQNFGYIRSCSYQNQPEVQKWIDYIEQVFLKKLKEGKTDEGNSLR